MSGSVFEPFLKVLVVTDLTYLWLDLGYLRLCVKMAHIKVCVSPEEAGSASKGSIKCIFVCLFSFSYYSEVEIFSVKKMTQAKVGVEVKNRACHRN